MKWVLGLGSNCGDRLNTLRKAIRLLKSSSTFSPGIRLLQASPIYESEALLPPGAPPEWNQPFLNLNLLCEISLSPQVLLDRVKGLESFLGRKPRGKWGPREIDIDLLLMESQTYQSENLNLPHPGLFERPFVLLPLQDLVPDWMNQWKIRPSRDGAWRSLQSLPELMGIVNLTTDSFSNEGLYTSGENTSAEQIQRSFKKRSEGLLQAGVRILDLGAESTRPGATKVPQKTEWERLELCLDLVKDLKTPEPITVSIDTRNPETAALAARRGANWINDVSGFQDIRMIQSVVDHPVELVFMHSLSVPPQKNLVLPLGQNSTDQLLVWAEDRIQSLEAHGVSRDRLIFDPGIGFGKTPAQSWEILRNVGRFQELGVRILVGHSRKSFISSVKGIGDQPASHRDLETAVISVELARNGVDYIRIHDEDSQTRSLKVWTQMDGVTQFQKL